MTDLDEIERLARAATPGKWVWWTSCSYRRLMAESITPPHTRGVIEPCVQRSDGHPDCIVSEEDRWFMEAANPAAILTLVARLRAAEEALGPFAWAAEDLDSNESGELWERPAAMSIECSHLRAAANHFAAYRALTKEPTP